MSHIKFYNLPSNYPDAPEYLKMNRGFSLKVMKNSSSIYDHLPQKFQWEDDFIYELLSQDENILSNKIDLPVGLVNYIIRIYPEFYSTLHLQYKTNIKICKTYVKFRNPSEVMDTFKYDVPDTDLMIMCLRRDPTLYNYLSYKKKEKYLGACLSGPDSQLSPDGIPPEFLLDSNIKQVIMNNYEINYSLLDEKHKQSPIVVYKTLKFIMKMYDKCGFFLNYEKQEFRLVTVNIRNSHQYYSGFPKKYIVEDDDDVQTLIKSIDLVYSQIKVSHKFNFKTFNDYDIKFVGF